VEAAFFLTRALLRREGALPPGSSVVFISSGRGHGATAGYAAYGTAKAALNHFAAMLAQDVGPRGIRVNVVSPGAIQSGHVPGPTEEEWRETVRRTQLGRRGIPEDVAGVVLFFASDLSAFVTGQCIQVNGGAW
jgi:3-oxoacyl-[acyl-carrier protein] reductase